MTILVTGSAGFIGYNLCLQLLKNKNNNIIGLDNINNYYDINLKKDRTKILKKNKNFKFKKINLLNVKALREIFKNNEIQYVVHLAAQAGVRHSIKKPKIYFKNNLEAFFNILDLSKDFKIKHFLFASTSSVYGDNNKFPLKEIYNTDKPLSFYAATKKSNEVIAHSYSYIYNLPCTGLRFFTVYGPYGRPDMALFKFSKNIIEGKQVELFNNGKHLRDFTYIDDIVNSILLIIRKPFKNNTPFKIFNIGNGKSKKLLDYLKEIENNLKMNAKIKKMPLQIGDIVKTHSDVSELMKYSNYKPKTNIDKGIKKFIKWYKKYYNINN